MSGSCPPVMAGVKRVLSQLLGAYTNIFAGLQWVYAFFMFFYGFLCLFLLFYGFYCFYSDIIKPTNKANAVIFQIANVILPATSPVFIKIS